MCPVKFLFAIVVLLGGDTAFAQGVPLPRPRPPGIAAEQSAAAEPQAEPSACQLRLAELASFKPLPPIEGPGECTATDVVALDAVLLADKRRVAVAPAATLRCPMAEAVAHWVREDVVPALAGLGTLRGVENFDSFECRGRNRVPGAKISEHGRANALDVRSFKLADGHSVALTDVNVAKPLRENLRHSACARFATVLGNGSDGYHETHVHIDLIERRGGYKMCQWDVLDAAEAAALAAKKAAEAAARAAAAAVAAEATQIPLPRPRPAALAAKDTDPPPRRRPRRR
jgi:hypothetical protein